MNDPGSSGARERYDRMLLLGAQTVFWTIPAYFVVSTAFLHQPRYVYWALGIGWAFAAGGFLAMKRGNRRLAGLFVLATMVEAVSVLVLAGGPYSDHVGAIFPAVAGSAFLLSIRATIATAVWFCLVFAASLVLHERGYYAERPQLDPVSVFAQIVALCAFVASVLYTYQRALEKVTRQQEEIARQKAEAAVEHETRLQLERRLRQGEKMEAFGSFAGGVAHDFNNLLTGVIGHAELVERALERDGADRRQLEDSLRQIRETAERGADITRQLLSFSRSDGGHPKEVDVAQTLADFESTLRRLLPEDIELVASYPASIHCRLPLRGVEQIIMNLVTNARDAMSEGGKLRIDCVAVTLQSELEVETGSLAPGEYVRLSVTDTGAGMSDSVRSRAFEPFFSTRRPGLGTGLGLSTVHGIVTRAGGGIGVESSPGLGSTITVHLPRVVAPEPAAQSKGVISTRFVGTERVLVCEDEKAILTVVRRTLERHGYEVFGFHDPIAALEAVREGAISPQVLLTDVVMPGMNGRVLSEELRMNLGELPVLYMSGHTDGILEARGVAREKIMLLQKPFTSKQLLSALRDCLQGAPA